MHTWCTHSDENKVICELKCMQTKCKPLLLICQILSIVLISWLKAYWSGVEVTKAAFINFSISQIFNPTKGPVIFFVSHSYLTVVSSDTCQISAWSEFWQCWKLWKIMERGKLAYKLPPQVSIKTAHKLAASYVIMFDNIKKVPVTHIWYILKKFQWHMFDIY